MDLLCLYYSISFQNYIVVNKFSFILMVQEDGWNQRQRGTKVKLERKLRNQKKKERKKERKKASNSKMIIILNPSTLFWLIWNVWTPNSMKENSNELIHKKNGFFFFFFFPHCFLPLICSSKPQFDFLFIY